jgi:YVTN family beta-propeller protein
MAQVTSRTAGMWDHVDRVVFFMTTSALEIGDVITAETDYQVPGETVTATIALGGGVSAMTVSPDGERTYVGQLDSVAVIDSSNRVAARIPIKGEPKALAVTADGSRLIAVYHSGSASVIDTRDHTVKTIAKGFNSDVVVAPDGRYVYAAHNGADHGVRYSIISVIDAHGAQVAAMAAANDLAALAVSPDGTRLYVVTTEHGPYRQYPSCWLTIIETAGNAVVDTIEIAPNPRTITASPDGLLVYITHDDAASVSAVDLTTNTVTKIALEDTALNVTITPDGTHAYLTHAGSLTVVDTVNHDTDGIITGDLPRGLQITPDGKRAYVTNFGDGSVSVIDTITNSITNTLTAGGRPETVAVSPDGQRVYVGDYWSGTVSVISSASVE